MKSDMVNMVTNNNTTEERARYTKRIQFFANSVVEEKCQIYYLNIMFIITITRGEDVTRN